MPFKLRIQTKHVLEIQKKGKDTQNFEGKKKLLRFHEFFVMVTSECTARKEGLACGVPFNVTNGVGVSFFFLCISNL